MERPVIFAPYHAERWVCVTVWPIFLYLPGLNSSDKQWEAEDYNFKLMDVSIK
jgi:hypothetical protein